MSTIPPEKLEAAIEVFKDKVPDHVMLLLVELMELHKSKDDKAICAYINALFRRLPPDESERARAGRARIIEALVGTPQDRLEFLFRCAAAGCQPYIGDIGKLV